MLNEEKVKSMTKAAAYENGPEKKNIGISGYFRADYLGLQMIKSGIAYAVSFCILAAIWAMSTMEELMLQLSRADYLESLLRTLIILFVAGLVVYEIAVYIYYSYKFHYAKKSVGGFHAHLKRIHKFYETEGSAGEEEYTEIDRADEEKKL